VIHSTCCCDKHKHVFSEYIRYRNETTFKEYEGTSIGRCTSCGLLKTFTPKRSFFNPKQSDIHFYEENIDLFTRLFTKTISRIQKYRKTGSVLDIGCSSGIILNILKDKGYEVFGIEPNRSAYNLARKKIGNVVYHGTLDTYKTKKKYDVIIFSHVLEHVPDPVNEIMTAKKLLSPHGILVIGIPNTRNLIFLLRRKFWEYLRPNEHIWHFSDAYLLNLLKRNRFEILETWHVNDERKNYPFMKRVYFSALCFINSVFKTGETVTVICRNTL
jgi:2-polyprenyl-3-methyl-5-hydroxy-6-metoxy-1,4-benzoquinol methylase